MMPKTDEDAVLAALRAVLTAMTTRDKDTLRDIMIPNCSSTRVRDGQLIHLPLGELADRFVEGVGHKEERIYEPLIRVDEDIAVIWVSYDFLLDGEVHHWGTNIVSFVKHEGRWLISGITDNGRTGTRPAGRRAIPID